MTANERDLIQDMQLAIERQTGELKQLNDKMDCVLEGRVAHCATQDARIAQHDKDIAEIKAALESERKKAEDNRTWTWRAFAQPVITNLITFLLGSGIVYTLVMRSLQQ